ncbi:uncharacterized protein (DUF305 family) [Duganella sp. 1224]|uniref:DUF305 domain-containing protein n=1 Tax=Duganella sp. 1224 TaxID=2587052 RepID=UPI0015CBF3DE|nr:DUF305 domain-containing protein [Duganella sp. 1224]NYE58861.1 uncharacterized protein (DUF305 family) [Duganella sp. 1224]
MRAAARFARLAALAVLPFAAAAASAQDHHQHGGEPAPAPATSAPPVFVASSAKPFAALMDDAMAVMDAGMRQAPMNGDPDHDFVSMMMPHHQGAVDMAKAVLLSTQDPEIRNLALGIIAEQQVEIQVMQAWLQHHPTKETRK